MRKLIALLLVLGASVASWGQAAYIKAVDTKTISTSGQVFTHLNIIGEVNVNVEYVISGSPTITSIILQGCMRGGTCQTLSTYLSSSSGVVSVTGLFDQYTITPTWTGGSSPSVTINWLATANTAPSSTNIAGSTDPCQNSGVVKSNVVVNIGSATTTQLVALSSTASVYVCSFYGTAVVGTAATYTWEYGTGSSCGTGTTALTGAMVGGGFLNVLGEFHTPVGQALCVVTGGTSPSYQGVLTYVQQ